MIYMNNKLGTFNTTPFLFIQEHKNNYKKYAEDALKGIQETDNLLSNVFFSKENMELIQNGLKKEVYVMSKNKFLIAKQSEQDLMVVMRAIFLTNASYSQMAIRDQIKELNSIVIGNLTPKILSAINFDLEYQKVINNPIQPMDRPKNMSSAGNKTLPSVNKIF